jgi:hypothetical protein
MEIRIGDYLRTRSDNQHMFFNGIIKVIRISETRIKYKYIDAEKAYIGWNTSRDKSEFTKENGVSKLPPLIKALYED